MMMTLYSTLLVLAVLAPTECRSNDHQRDNVVKVVGAMRDVMWKGQLAGTISLDTMGNKQHLYGVGPAEFLSGELLIFDGKSYVSSVLTDSTMEVRETSAAKAPFFVYANVEQWHEHDLPESIRTVQHLERFLEEITKTLQRPFVFTLNGMVDSATIHVVNLPKGAIVRSPEDAHQGQKSYGLKHQQVKIVGFFSTEHKTIFTHHDTFMHMHLITADKRKMGHLDEAIFTKGTLKLSLPMN